MQLDFFDVIVKKKAPEKEPESNFTDEFVSYTGMTVSEIIKRGGKIKSTGAVLFGDVTYMKKSMQVWRKTEYGGWVLDHEASSKLVSNNKNSSEDS